MLRIGIILLTVLFCSCKQDQPRVIIGKVNDLIIADTTIKVKDSTINYNSFLFTIRNISDTAIYLGRTFSVFFIHRQAKDKSGHWVNVDRKLSELGICGVGQPTITLKPNEIVVSKVRRYNGNFNTDFRLVFGNENNVVYSNIFKDSIDERMLVTD